MKLIPVAAFALVLAVSSTGSLAAESAPALDFREITPAQHGEYVEIDLDQGLLTLASRFAAVQEKEAAEVLRGLRHVRVHVIGVDDANRAAVLERIRDVRTRLAGGGWKRIALVTKGSGEDVAVFARMENGEAINGLAVTVVEGSRQAVIVDVEGEIKPDQIAALGERFDLDPLKKLAVAKN